MKTTLVDGARWRQRTTYDWTNAWHQDSRGYWVQNYGDTPAARMEHAMAYDSRRGRVVMFGGRGYQALISAACGTVSTVPAILTTDPGLQIFAAQQGAAQLVWSAANVVLQEADFVNGPWTTVPGATSPFDLSLQGLAKFFRLNTNCPAGP